MTDKTIENKNFKISMETANMIANFLCNLQLTYPSSKTRDGILDEMQNLKSIDEDKKC